VNSINDDDDQLEQFNKDLDKCFDDKNNHKLNELLYTINGMHIYGKITSDPITINDEDNVFFESKNIQFIYQSHDCIGLKMSPESLEEFKSIAENYDKTKLGIGINKEKLRTLNSFPSNVALKNNGVVSLFENLNVEKDNENHKNNDEK
jgi:hypothetical protein